MEPGEHGAHAGAQLPHQAHPGGPAFQVSRAPRTTTLDLEFYQPFGIRKKIKRIKKTSIESVLASL